MDDDMMLFNGVRCTYAEWARLESEYKGKLDLQIKLVDAKREGRQEGERIGEARGEARGKARGVEQTARNALAKGYTFEQVRDITGLDIQAIKTLQTQ